MSEKIDLVIKGLNEKEVKEFIDWYSGSGEQDSEIWFYNSNKNDSEIRNFIGVDGIKTYPLMKQSKYVVTGNVFIMYIGD